MILDILLSHSQSPVCDDLVYGLSMLCCSGQIANHIEHIAQQHWGVTDIAYFVNDREESNEEADIEDDGFVYVDSDKGLEENGEDDDELIAGQGQDGISPWDILGEGFLREASC